VALVELAVLTMALLVRQAVQVVRPIYQEEMQVLILVVVVVVALTTRVIIKVVTVALVLSSFPT
jgi:hypothetical protein